MYNVRTVVSSESPTVCFLCLLRFLSSLVGSERKGRTNIITRDASFLLLYLMSKELDSGIQIVIYFMCQGFAQFDQQLIYNKTNDFQAAINFCVTYQSQFYVPLSVPRFLLRVKQSMGIE